MGSPTQGVEVRATSVRLHFTWQGKRYRQTLMTAGEPMAPTPRNVRYAERLIAEIKAKIKVGAFAWSDYFAPKADTGTPTTVRAHLTRWLSTARVAESSTSGYVAAINFWCNTTIDGTKVGDLPLSALRKSHLDAAIARRPDLSAKSVRNYLGVLHRGLAGAIDDGLLMDNPTEKVKRPRARKVPPDPFTADEREAIISWLRTRSPATVHNMVEFWFWTGLRTSELFGLRWGSVDLRSGHVLVHEALIRGKHKDSTKTDTDRIVRLNSRARAAIERQRAVSHLAGEHVFIDPRSGCAWTNERAFRRSHWVPCLKSLKIRYRRPYNMRHTYATAMLMAPGGMMNPAFCARQLGHSVKLFLETYSRWIDGQQDDAEMGRLEIVPGAAPSVADKPEKPVRSTA